jgi:hypothetical protein
MTDEAPQEVRDLVDRVAADIERQEAAREMLQGRACDCCGHADRQIAGVGAIPGVPMSILWCVECIKAQVIPYPVLVSQVALAGGYNQCHPGYQVLVDATLAYFGKTRDEFDTAVQETAREFDQLAEESAAETGEAKPWTMPGESPHG